MPNFNYIALDGAGRRLAGELEAASEEVLERRLRANGQWLAEVREVVLSRKAGLGRGNVRVPRRAMVDFFLQLGLQIKAGVPIESALAFGARHEAHVGFRAVQSDLLLRIKSGTSLSEAMSAHPRTFAPMTLSVIRAGEASGRLRESCAELQRHFEWVDRLMGDVRQALFYPMFVLVCTVLFLVLVFNFMVPRFAKMLTELNVPLPALTTTILGLSQFMVAHGVWLLIGLVILVFGCTLAPRWVPVIGFLVDGWKLKVPVFGELMKMICLSRFTHNFGMLFHAGIPLLDCLLYCREIVGNKVVAAAVTDIHAGVNEGKPIHEMMARHPVFPGLIIQLVHVGEATGCLDEALHNAADYYNDALPRRVKRVFAVFEPCLIITLIVVVGIVALAIMLPIAEMLGKRN